MNLKLTVIQITVGAGNRASDSEGIGNWRKNNDDIDHDKNIHGYLRRLAVTLTPVKDYAGMKSLQSELMIISLTRGIFRNISKIIYFYYLYSSLIFCLSFYSLSYPFYIHCLIHIFIYNSYKHKPKRNKEYTSILKDLLSLSFIVVRSGIGDSNINKGCSCLRFIFH